MKDIIVVFTANNARIARVDRDHLPHYANVSNILINPGLGRVKGLSPQFWKQNSGEVVPMDSDETLYRMRLLEEEPTDNVMSITGLVVVPGLMSRLWMKIIRLMRFILRKRL